jgi:hypothetical protein
VGGAHDPVRAAVAMVRAIGAHRDGVA